LLVGRKREAASRWKKGKKLRLVGREAGKREKREMNVKLVKRKRKVVGGNRKYGSHEFPHPMPSRVCKPI
jgi:hypothetical protein